MTIRLCCIAHREEFVALGLTDEAIEDAIRRGPGCCPTDPSEGGGKGKPLPSGDHPFGPEPFPLPALLLVAGLFIAATWAVGTALGALMSAVT